MGRITSLFISVLVVTALVFAVSGCGSDDADSGGSAPAETATQGATEATAGEAGTEVEIGDNFFKPQSITVKVGDTVTWTNSGQAPHTVTADDKSFDSGTVQSGDKFEQKFEDAGNFPYVCTIHPGQEGEVVVE